MRSKRALLFTGIGLVCALQFIGVGLVSLNEVLRSRSRTTLILDPTKPATFMLVGGSRSTSGLSIRITGEIDESALVQVGQQKQRIAGKVDWQSYQDWFYPDCELDYEPDGVTSGALKVEYTFD